MPVIREACLEDALVLARFAEETFRETFSEMNSAEDIDAHCKSNFGAEIQRKEIESQTTITLLCEHEEELVGFAHLCWDEHPTCITTDKPIEIRRLYVDGEWHGRGIAHPPMDESIAEAVKRGSDSVWLGVWEDNPRAISFYKKFDFTEVGEHKFQLGSDLQRDIVMLRLLSN